jgi:hypothetical protein
MVPLTSGGGRPPSLMTAARADYVIGSAVKSAPPMPSFVQDAFAARAADAIGTYSDDLASAKTSWEVATAAKSPANDLRARPAPPQPALVTAAVAATRGRELVIEQRYDPKVADMRTSWETEGQVQSKPTPAAAQADELGSSSQSAPPQPALVSAAIMESRRARSGIQANTLTGTTSHMLTSWEQEGELLRHMELARAGVALPTPPSTSVAAASSHGPPEPPTNMSIDDLRRIVTDLDSMWSR